jgi:hypothetical protein
MFAYLVPGGLLIAAIVTTFPLCGEFEDWISSRLGALLFRCAEQQIANLCLVPNTRTLAFLLLPLDALAGYVFARMAHNEGIHIPKTTL